MTLAREPIEAARGPVEAPREGPRSGTRVCFFGAYDPGYPRNRILREGLRRRGLEVIEARVNNRRAFRRYPALLLAFLRRARDADVILVPEFRHKDVPIASRLKGRRRLVFDPLVSRHDTLVGDWGLHREGSGQARWNRMIDRWALSLPDLVLCDTWAHGGLFERLGAPRERLRRVLVGAEQAFFEVGPPSAGGPLRIVYVGGFLPLHGVPVVVEAIARLERDARRLPEFTVSLVGRGIELERARDLAGRCGLTRLEFAGPCPYDQSPAALAGAHVVLGAFGGSDKAGRVIPHKVYQGLAAGRAVVTGDGSGLREVFEPGVHLRTVPRADATSLAACLAQLLVGGDERVRLGERGRRRMLEVGTPERIGESLVAALEGGGERMP
jgi:glycosyltransferase involved in cell wall biosynthesis